MKLGRDLRNLIDELERRESAAQDFIADTREMRVSPEGEFMVAANEPIRMEGIGDVAHQQIATALNVPASFYNDLRTSLPELWASTINGLFAGRPAARKMVRSLDGNARALLSDRYNRIDNLAVFSAIIPAIVESQAKVVSAEVTETNLYIKAVWPKLQTDVAKGDPIQAGIVIANSEVGLGAVKVQPLVYRLVCDNGLIRADNDVKSLRRNHVGRRFATAEAAYAAITSAETQHLEHAAFLSTVRDVALAFSDETQFRAYAARLAESKEKKIVGDVPGAVERLRTSIGLTTGESSAVLRHLIESADLSAYGLLNAVTRTAQDVESYDRATRLEELGSRVIDLPASEWRSIAEAEPLAA